MGGIIKQSPVIAVTGPDKKLKFGWWATRLMLWLCGLRGIYLTARHAQLPENIRGIIIGGGDDIEPEHYGALADPSGAYDPERDHFEMEMIRNALKAEIPMLGICRGAQLINVVLGGSLYLDIRSERKFTPNKKTLRPIKWANIKSETRLHSLIEKSRIRINSLHNQAVNNLGKGLAMSAIDDDGFVQAIESTKNDFVIGVQWHPEYLPYKSDQRRLFQSFATAVKQSNALLKSNP